MKFRLRIISLSLVSLMSFACGANQDKDNAALEHSKPSNDNHKSDLQYFLDDLKEIQEKSGPAPQMREDDLKKIASETGDSVLRETSTQKLTISSNNVSPETIKDSASLVDTRNSLLYYRQLRTYEKSHPDATQEELEEYVEEILHTQPQPEANDADASSVSTQALNFIDGPNYKLNPTEQAIYSKNTVIGLKMLAAGYYALQLSYSYWNSGFTDGNADAFRHCLWNVYMCSIANCSWAKQWGDAHEAYNSYGKPREMDLNNNQFGRNLFAYYGSYASNWVPTATWGGYLIRIVGNRFQITNRQGYKY